jgi:hypothetical protein
MTTPKVSFLDIAQTLAAYLAIPALVVYPFGFAALFLQFMRYFGLDVYTAWYAASLVNRMVVLGLGATILLVALLGSVLLSGKVSQILLRHENRASSHLRVRRRMLSVKVAFVSLIALILYVLYSRLLAAGRLYGRAIFGREPTECRLEALRHQLDLWPDSLIPAGIFVAGGLWGGWLIYKSYQKYRHSRSANMGQYSVADYSLRPGFFSRGITQGWILSGLTVAYLSGIVASLVLTWFTPGFVPFATYGETVEYPGKEPTTDRFLSHAEGHWYFLHRIEPEGGEREYRILALREGTVTYVRIQPQPAWATRVAPFVPWSWSAPSSPAHILDWNLCEKPLQPYLPQNAPEVPST